MTTAAPTEPTGLTLPAPVAELRACGDRLAAVDLWADAARVRVVLLDETTSPQDRLEAAWACFRSGAYDQAAKVLDGMPGALAPVKMLTQAVAAVQGDLGAYHRLLADIEDGAGTDPLALRIAMTSAVENDDPGTASRIAKRLLAVAPNDADAWTVVAAEKAAIGDPVTALAAVEKARADRFDCQPDPAAQTMALLDARGHHEAASMLAAHGAVHETGTRPGWSGWRTLLTERHPRTLGLSDAPYAGAAAFVAAAGAFAIIQGHPWAIVVDAAAAGAFLAMVRSRPVGGLSGAASRLVRAAHGRRSRTEPSAVTKARDRVDPFTSARKTGLDPTVCSCWETTWFSGPSAATYIAEHLHREWHSDDLDLALGVCPATKQEWVLVPGFAVRAPDGTEEGAPGSPVTATAAASPEDGVKTGQYL